MDIIWYGQACFRVKGRAGTVVFDPFTPATTGLKLPHLSADIVCVSHGHPDHNYVAGVKGGPFVIQLPGEYEIAGIDIVALPTFHDAVRGSVRGKNLVMVARIDGITIAHLGDLGHLLTDPEKETVGHADVLLVPVGGVHTIDAATAAKVVSQCDPEIVIPMHYKIADLAYDLSPVDDFLKVMGKEGVEPTPKLSIKGGELPEEQEVVVLEKQ